MRVDFTIPGEPQGKARPKVFNGHGVTPEKTVLYENLIKLCFTEQGGQHLGEGPLNMIVFIYLSIPKSASRKRANLMRGGKIRPTKKPDADNVLKVVADALNGVAYKDDSQIASVGIHKHYADNPRVEVTIWREGKGE